MSAGLRAQVLAAARQCYAEGLFAGTSGNLSAYDAEAGLMAVTPSGLAYEGMEAGDIVLMRLDGTVAEGTQAPSSEWRLHAGIYAARPEAGAVVHTHSPYATAFAAARRPIPAALIEMVLFLGGEVPLAPFALPGTDAVAQSALAAMGPDGAACLLANHGVVAVGKSLDEARLRAVYVEDAAKICTLAAIHGAPVALDETELQAMRDLLMPDGPKK